MKKDCVARRWKVADHRKIVGSATTVLEGASHKPHKPELAFHIIDVLPPGGIVQTETKAEMAAYIAEVRTRRTAIKKYRRS